MASSDNVLGNKEMGPVDGDGLAAPRDVADVLDKHKELRAGAEAAAQRGRGRPRKDGKPAGGVRPAVRPSDGGDVPPDLFTPDTVRPFMELPFGIGNVWFKTDAFTLDKYESDTLSRQGSLVANLYAPGWNPKAVALTALALGFASISTKKLMVFLGERAEKKKREEQGEPK